ncbi:MAG TPA: lytic transglycosylase domain-containing protein [Candidatus Polarisedimenticolia bacterium]|nr:lytic transglycosylase domain-containing protein [Candidatus Polarisedimenticolia bacterium]
MAGMGVAIAAFAAVPSQASHVVTFTGGGTLEIASYRMEGSRIIVTLEGGGELAFPAMQVSGIAKSTTPAPVPVPPAPIAPPAVAPQSPQAATEIPHISPWDPEPGVRALIRQVAASMEVDPKLLEALVETESKFDPYAVSRKGAMGLMQLMPDTARRFEVGNVFDPRQNLEGGTRYLKELLARYDDTALALAAYNAGEDAVDRYKGIPPYRETRGYVSRILRRMKP